MGDLSARWLSSGCESIVHANLEETEVMTFCFVNISEGGLFYLMRGQFQFLLPLTKTAITDRIATPFYTRFIIKYIATISTLETKEMQNKTKNTHLL